MFSTFPWDRRRLRAARSGTDRSRAPRRITVSLPNGPTAHRPVPVQFGNFVSNSNAATDESPNGSYGPVWIWVNNTIADMYALYEDDSPSGDDVIDYLTELRDETDQQSEVGSPSYSRTPSPLEPDRTVKVEYMSDILCPIARNLPIRTLTNFIETAVHHAISAARLPDVHPYPVYITVIINNSIGEHIPPPALLDPAISFTVTNPPPPQPPNPPSPRPPQPEHDKPALLDHNHAFKYLIDYEMAYNDLKQCTFPPGHKDDPNFPLEQRSSRFDPMSRLTFLSRMLRSYFQLRLSSTSWLDDPIPSDGVLECVWHFMRQVVEEGDRRALSDLHIFLDPTL